jgi:hypothetical protein
MALGFAIVSQDQAALRAAPRVSAPQHAVLWQGELLEVRGERMDYLQVYDHRRERAGFVRASQARRVMLQPGEAPELLSVVRFLRESPGSEALGIGFTAAWLKAAPAELVNSDAGVEALDALGTFAERLANRASSGSGPGKAAQTAVSAHLDVAARYGVGFTSHERAGRVQICYDGEAYRRVLAMNSSPEQRARAALALTRRNCSTEKDTWHAEVLDRVEVDKLPGYLRNRILMRRAVVWSGLAYQQARRGEASAEAAARAVNEFARISKSELAEVDTGPYQDAAMRVSASRWALAPAAAGDPERKPYVVATPAANGETCLQLLDAKQNTMAKRCTFGHVWTASASLNREGTALALAVQPTETWREIWIFRKAASGWTVRILPPATATPEVGYIDFAGWVPGGAQMLVAREALGEGRYQKSFEVVRLDTLATAQRAGDPGILSAFKRWQDPSWKQASLSVR